MENKIDAIKDILKGTNEAILKSEAMIDYCTFMSETVEDEKVKAEWLVKADTFKVTLEENKKGYENFVKFYESVV